MSFNKDGSATQVIDVLFDSWQKAVGEILGCEAWPISRKWIVGQSDEETLAICFGVPLPRAVVHPHFPWLRAKEISPIQKLTPLNGQPIARLTVRFAPVETTLPSQKGST